MSAVYGCMKHILFSGFFGALIGAALLAVSCADRPIPSSYRPFLPEFPAHREEILGEPCWRLEWINENGVWQEWEGINAPELSLNREWTTPVLAWPYWPEKGLLPGMMRPAGALFPWDVSGEALALSWKGGVEAVFWKEMALAERPNKASGGRLPWYFDWPRFRELMESSSISENVRLNPWLADWKHIAQRTVASGFDNRRLVSRAFSELAVPVQSGVWIGSSPFEPPLEAGPDGFLVLNVAELTDTWVSKGAVLKCSGSGWVYRKLER